jgi:hypothetical protein
MGVQFGLNFGLLVGERSAGDTAWRIGRLAGDAEIACPGDERLEKKHGDASARG